ncbi:4833_t:CDS:2 [Gigaspora margarita]|uniref:4833_t:CDS:1 n=1 Tax=Gigaspora margarita TaxID=4874 RepID=A0ABM8W5I8_GIGMA|nr:4833_t:CDS:2 [Gigaspora margarita]
MGKPKGNVWKHWTILDTNNQSKDSQEDYSDNDSEDYEENNESQSNNQEKINKPHPRVKCNYCPKTFEHGLSSRIQKHLNSCLNAPNNAKTNVNIKRKNPTVFGGSTQKHLKTILIDNFIDNLNEDEQETLEFMLAQAIFATGTSFTFVENPYIINLKDITNNAKALVKYFKSHTQAKAKLQRIQNENYKKEIALVLLVLTRWGTHFECFQSLQKSQIAIEQTLMDSRICQTMDSGLRFYVLQDEFWENLKLVTNILKPIVVTLKLFESNESTLSSIYSNFRKMISFLQEISSDFSDEIQILAEERWNYAYHDIMIIAYIVDPRFLEESKALNIEAASYNTFTSYCSKRFGEEKSVNLFTGLVKFRNQEFLYNNEIIWKSANTLTPSTYNNLDQSEVSDRNNNNNRSDKPVNKEVDNNSEFDQDTEQDIEQEIYDNIYEIIDSENDEIYETSNVDDINSAN